MKRFFLLALFVVMALSLQVAYAAPQTIDLDTMTKEELTALDNNVHAALARITVPGEVLTKAARKSPAYVGQTVELAVHSYSMDYTVRVTLLEVYRGGKFNELVKGKYLADLSSPEKEFIAAKVSVTFVSIESIDTKAANSDDPELMIDAIMSFKTYNGDGAQYDNVHYGVSDMPEVKPIREGATTEGYMYFEVDKNDASPFLVFLPDMFGEQEAWFTLAQ
jgi:hypothetical protein